MWWHYLIGYMYSVIIGAIFISILRSPLNKFIGLSEEKDRGQLPFMVGILERLLYTSSFIFGKPEFIGVWLILKVFAGWKKWHEGDISKNIEGRDFFNVFLILNGFSVAFGVFGARLIEWLVLGSLWRALSGSLGLIIFVLLFVGYAIIIKNKRQIK